MNSTISKHLLPKDIEKLSSTYLIEGRKKEVWEILDISIEDRVLKAHIRMKSRFISPTDDVGFHLTIFTTLEFLSQLTIIYSHVWAGYTEKTREGWMIESSIKSKHAVRDPENIFVHMEVSSIKKIGDNMMAITQSRIFDDQGGLFEARLKGFLS